MIKFEDLYKNLINQAVNSNGNAELGKDFNDDFDEKQLDCLLHPKDHPVIWRIGDCDCSEDQQKECANNCLYNAKNPNKDGSVIIDEDKCVGCSDCVDKCKSKNLTTSRDIIPVIQEVKSKKGLVYALIAPAFLGQFSSNITPGKLRTALKQVGFDGMLEVALFADILTLKEALEFDRNIINESDFQLTSCCCPLWIAMIRKKYNELMPHIPAAVSPMIACGRTVKHLYPDSLTVFIGPCVAKKAEAREADLVGDVDYVLTFQEMKDVFEAMNINPEKMEESDRDHSSRAGRIYARTGGVSESVEQTLKRLNPDRSIRIKTQQADGVPACKQMMIDLVSGKATANFFEGMGCVGGCVGGPKAIISAAQGRINVNEYGDKASNQTPIENPYVIEMLNRLGLDTVDRLLEQSDIFTRKFE